MARKSMTVVEEITQTFVGLIIYGVVLFFVLLGVIKVPWEMLVPDLFPGAVHQGLVAGTISWQTTFLLAAALACLAGILRTIRFPWEKSAKAHLAEFKIDTIIRHLGIDFETALTTELTAMAKSGLKGEAIAIYREHTSTGLADAQDHIAALERSAPASS